MNAHALDIESTANPRVKAWVALSSRSERDRTGTFLIEGVRETERALDRLVPDELIWCPQYAIDPLGGDEAATAVSPNVFDKISHRQNPDGIAAILRTPSMSLDAFVPHDNALVLVADGIEKPGNIGAILRSCDAFGASFLGSSLGTDLVNPNTIRAAQGSLFTVPIASVSRIEAIAWCVEHTQVIVAHPEGAESLWTRDVTSPTSVVIGSEHAGVDPSWLNAGLPTVVPMAGVADSLNASVTAGVFLGEAARQRSV